MAQRGNNAALKDVPRILRKEDFVRDIAQKISTQQKTTMSLL
jgi:hypothetical protein